MNGQLRQPGKNFASSATAMIALSLVCISIAACSKGEGVQLGTGQNPDPVVVDFPIAYIKAPLPVDDNGVFEQQDLREQITFEFGGDLYFRDRAAVGAEPVNITGDITQGLGAIRDVEIDYDASRLLFSMRTPFEMGVAEEDQVATWNIWQYRSTCPTVASFSLRPARRNRRRCCSMRTKAGFPPWTKTKTSSRSICMS